jgi:hypothetical protein
MQENILNERHTNLLDMFERDVAPCDKISELSMVMTPVGIMSSILVPLLLYGLLVHGNPYTAITVFPYFYLVVGGILTTVLLTRSAIVYADHEKHKISRKIYRPITGFCMCDLSMLRSHTKKVERARTMGERIRYVKLVNYYTEKIIRERDIINK